MIYSITYSDVQDTANPGLDGKSFGFNFSYIPAEKKGQPDQKSYLKLHRVIVTISNSVLKSWHLSDDELIKVLFEIGRRFIKKEISDGKSWDSYSFTMLPMISTETHKECPFDPSLIPSPQGLSEDVEISKKIGF
jgi:hypothetical protein